MMVNLGDALETRARQLIHQADTASMPMQGRKLILTGDAGFSISGVPVFYWSVSPLEVQLTAVYHETIAHTRVFK